MPTFDEVMAMAASPETVVPLIVGGDKLLELRELGRQLADAPAPTSLADRNPAAVIAERIAEVQDELRGTEVEFRLRAASGRVWTRLLLSEPKAKKDQEPDEFADQFFAWLCNVVAATCVDPVMTAEQVAELADRLPGAAWDSLSNTAWAINAGTVSVPFSSAVSAMTRASAQTSKPQSDSGSPTASSAEPAVRRQRRMSTTTPAA